MTEGFSIVEIVDAIRSIGFGDDIHEISLDALCVLSNGVFPPDYVVADYRMNPFYIPKFWGCGLVCTNVYVNGDGKMVDMCALHSDDGFYVWYGAGLDYDAFRDFTSLSQAIGPLSEGDCEKVYASVAVNVKSVLEINGGDRTDANLEGSIKRIRRVGGGDDGTE